ncbi:FtsX-like permease family protein [Fulvivirga sp. M361]|uniref:ABC transporter permease n=1 Tax=Fulvivirga sp. M361 TaxID=2594266 RepID=UPI001179AFF7|nr:ABC transporter permease [Fulvivirga sp. M361]TRX56168.1 FtsX-like permease family protein [Fulvivirga sp. M361]
MKKHLSPPKLPLRFFRWYCHPDYREDIEGDLMERLERNTAEKDIRSARWMFIKDVVRLFRPGIIRSLSGSQKLNTYDMFKNYYKVGIRNILKYKTFSFINIFDLAVALSVCMLIILMLADQTGYDRFHVKKDRIYRVLMHPASHSNPYATAPVPISDAMKQQYPIIEDATCLRRGLGGDAVYNNKAVEVKGYFADVSFFNLFSYALEKGDASTAFDKPNSIVIAKGQARKLFGEEDPIGKSIDLTDRGIDFFSDESKEAIDWGTYTVTGVLADNDHRSHLEFDVLVSSSSLELLYKEGKISDLSNDWSNHYQAYVYLLLKESSTEKDLEASLAQLASKQYSDDERLKGSELIPQQLTKITPGPALGNAPTTRLPLFVYYILSALALTIMVFACLNYSNLSIARAVTRTKEIGVRKVNGARRKDLIFQFLSESIITALLAFILACILLNFVKSAFLGLWINNYLSFDLSSNLTVYLISLGFALLIGVLAGAFPALHLSGFKPVRVLKNLKTGRGRLGTRKVLTIAQFVISLLFIITSIVVFKQFRHFMQHEYGFNAGNVMNVNLRSNDFRSVKAALSSVPGVSDVAGSAYLPATGRNDNIVLKADGTEDKQKAIYVSVDENFINVLDIDLIAGQKLYPTATDTNPFIMVNEAMTRAFGYDSPKDIIGESFETLDGQLLKVTGVVEDFTFHLLINGRPIGPVVMRNEPEKFKFASLKIAPGNTNDIITAIEKKWKTVDPVHPLEYEYYEDRLANNNQGIFDVVSIIGFIAFLAISIACLGLLGIAIYTTERRTKEVGIRKVFGASSIKLALLLSKEFFIILVISISIAAPLSHYLNSLWLNFLVTKIELGYGTVFLGSMLLLVLGLMTIGPQTFRIANGNPVNSLKNE